MVIINSSAELDISYIMNGAQLHNNGNIFMARVSHCAVRKNEARDGVPKEQEVLYAI